MRNLTTFTEGSFKPYYKWITFNTAIIYMPSPDIFNLVLNLIINGLPSIQYNVMYLNYLENGFKPYYKWITFNTPKILLMKF